MIAILRVILVIAIIVFIIARIMRKRAERRVEDEKRKNRDIIDVDYTEEKN